MMIVFISILHSKRARLPTTQRDRVPVGHGHSFFAGQCAAHGDFLFGEVGTQSIHNTDG